MTAKVAVENCYFHANHRHRVESVFCEYGMYENEFMKQVCCEAYSFDFVESPTTVMGRVFGATKLVANINEERDIRGGNTNKAGTTETRRHERVANAYFLIVAY